MTNYNADYANLAQYNNGIAFKPWHESNKNNQHIVSKIKTNIFGKQSTSGYHTMENGYIRFPTNCTNITTHFPPANTCVELGQPCSDNLSCCDQNAFCTSDFPGTRRICQHKKIKPIPPNQKKTKWCKGGKACCPNDDGKHGSCDVSSQKPCTPLERQKWEREKCQ